MKRLNSNSAVSKLGESAYNALVMTNQVNGDEKRILHYSYNLSGQERQASAIGADNYGALTRNKPLFGSQRITRRAYSKEEEEKQHFDKALQRSNSIGHLPYSNGSKNGLARSTKRGQFMFSGGATRNVQENSTTDGVSKRATEDPVTGNNGSRESYTRKYGLGEKTNVSIMSHKLRKKAVCDSTDNSHYQRQFLRVLNKRF